MAVMIATSVFAQEPFWLGADISGTTALEAHGGQLFNAQGEKRENTQLMKDYGLNAVRLRGWVNPKDGFCNKEDVLVMAKRAKAHDMAIMIDFHYSDWWADPAKQNIPEAWKELDYKQMKKALAKHTRETLQLLKDNDIDVKWVRDDPRFPLGYGPCGKEHETICRSVRCWLCSCEKGLSQSHLYRASRWWLRHQALSFYL